MVSLINNTSMSTLIFTSTNYPIAIIVLLKKKKKEKKRAWEQSVHLPWADSNNRGCQPFSQQIRTRRTPPFCSPPPPPPPRPLPPTTCVEKTKLFTPVSPSYLASLHPSPFPSSDQSQPSTFAESRATPLALSLSRFKKSANLFSPARNREDR